jgi:hypothetical protein
VSAGIGFQKGKPPVLGAGRFLCRSRLAEQMQQKSLFDHLVGGDKQRRRQVEAERPFETHRAGHPADAFRLLPQRQRG